MNVKQLTMNIKQLIEKLEIETTSRIVTYNKLYFEALKRSLDNDSLEDLAKIHYDMSQILGELVPVQQFVSELKPILTTIFDELKEIKGMNGKK